MAAAGVDPEAFRTVDLYSSHEALLLDYERALTRIDSRTGLPYDVSGHLVWVGERTRDLGGAHVAFAASVRNPVAVKLGPTTTPDEAWPWSSGSTRRRARAGSPSSAGWAGTGCATRCPPVVEKVTASGATVAWVCDPMHGNTFEAPDGLKTRRFDDVIDEVRGFFEVHRALGTHPGGLHMELTGDDVTECLGGSGGIGETDLPMRYQTVCDPRLNHAQSLELAFLVAEMLAAPPLIVARVCWPYDRSC
jgi:3-deoxy-7-phosphoheptulonate synthase